MPSALESDLSYRNLIHQVTSRDVFDQISNGGMSAYAGFDPTSNSLHVGHLLPLLTLRRLQENGVRPIVVAGGGTGMIGDPSGKSAERNLLEPDLLASNLRAIEAQLGRLLDFDSPNLSTRAVLVDNSSWLSGLSLLEFLRDVGKHFSVSQMIAKDSVKLRLERSQGGISYTEFSYMLLQAYDFAWLYDNYNCKIQIGASDQWGNITMGIELIRRLRGAESWGITIPLLTQGDGTKFGKTESGSVWLDASKTSPYELYQFFLNTSDADIGQLMKYFSFQTPEGIEELIKLTASEPEARRAQRALAGEVVEMVHGTESLSSAKRISESLFSTSIDRLSEKELNEAFGNAPSSKISMGLLAGPGISLLEIMAQSGLEKSLSSARRTVTQGGAYVNNQKQTDPELVIDSSYLLCNRYLVLRKGKKTFHVVTFA